MNDQLYCWVIMHVNMNKISDYIGGFPDKYPTESKYLHEESDF
jgi:hypothetical protein